MITVLTYVYLIAAGFTSISVSISAIYIFQVWYKIRNGFERDVIQISLPKGTDYIIQWFCGYYVCAALGTLTFRAVKFAEYPFQGLLPLYQMLLLLSITVVFVLFSLITLLHVFPLVKGARRTWWTRITFVLARKKK
jgi:hypothetical protein